MNLHTRRGFDRPSPRKLLFSNTSNILSRFFNRSPKLEAGCFAGCSNFLLFDPNSCFGQVCAVELLCASEERRVPVLTDVSHDPSGSRTRSSVLLRAASKQPFLGL